MKLSEAIREGAKLRPQTTGDLFTFTGDWENNQLLESCALGAAYEGKYGTPEATCEGITLAEQRMAQWCRTSKLRGRQPCPVANSLYCLGTRTTGDLITHLNDNHIWTREQIADWLEGQGL